MNPALSPLIPQATRNFFRAAWTYRRLPAGEAMLASGKGLSPAFFNLLDAVDADRAISFADLGAMFPRLDADDLELWLAELCRMQFIAPAEQAPGMAGAQIAAVAAHPPRVLLVHREHTVRLAWRKLLAVLQVEMIEAASLEDAEAAYNELQPRAVVLGPGSGDFNTVNLLNVIKHPRAPLQIKAFLMLDTEASGSGHAQAVARADETVPAAEWDSLAQRVARQLGLMPPVQQSQEVVQAARATAPAGVPQVALEAANGPTADAAASWKHAPLDALYSELLAICAELEAREASPPALALAA